MTKPDTIRSVFKTTAPSRTERTASEHPLPSRSTLVPTTPRSQPINMEPVHDGTGPDNPLVTAEPSLAFSSLPLPQSLPVCSADEKETADAHYPKWQSLDPTSFVASQDPLQPEDAPQVLTTKAEDGAVTHLSVSTELKSEARCLEKYIQSVSDKATSQLNTKLRALSEDLVENVDDSWPPSNSKPKERSKHVRLSRL